MYPNILDNDFTDCQNWDKDYFKNCTPVDCEERYFGLSYFYNSTVEKCQEMPRYLKKYQVRLEKNIFYIK